MPELPDIVVYIEHLGRRIVGASLLGVNVLSPNLLRTFDPPLETAVGARVHAVRRIGKRIALGLDGELWLVLHLMIAGRLRWAPASPIAVPTTAAAPPRATRRDGRNALATFAFSTGTLSLTEASSKKRASLHLVRGGERLRSIDPGGIEPLDATAAELRAAMTRENRTLKRALTDPRLVSGIGNAYSDEILHRARLSPMRQTGQLDADEWERLHDAVRRVLVEWTDRLLAASGDNFPTGVTAFREGMAVHGRYRKPCPACGAPVQRIVYAENEANYCARCQTGGRLLADRALSRLLRRDWPRRLEDLDGD